MPSSFSTDLKIELMVTGENAGTWGDNTNDNLAVVEQAIAGFESISIAGGAQTTTLAIANSPDIVNSKARNAVIKLTGTITGNQIVTIPTGITKTYIVQNGTTGAFTVEFKQAGGTGTTFSATDKGIKILFADGTNINPVDLNTLSGDIATDQIENLAVTSAKLASFAVTSARLASFAVTTSRLATNAVTGVKITQSTITQSKLATGSVGPDQLIATAVTPAAYTSANITVDADGRITAASSGSAGAGMGIPTRFSLGPTSGTHTASPSANRMGVYLYAGGGGGGGGRSEPVSSSGGAGGGGGFGFYNKPIAQPFAQPFSVGAPGNSGAGGTGGTGGAGGATNFTNVGSVNAGNGGNGGTVPGTPGSAGSSGAQPGASFTYPARTFVVGANYGSGGGGGDGNGNSGGAGGAGLIAIFENTGT